MGIPHRHISCRYLHRHTARVSSFQIWAFDFGINSYRSEEMKPQWFRLDNNANLDLAPIPYDKLWESDHIWLPLLLGKRHFVARTDYAREGEKDVLQKWWFGAQADVKDG